MKPNDFVLALDLEGTLISSAVSQFPRPGLKEFLVWAFERFDRVLLYTSVREEKAREVIQNLINFGEVESETLERLEFLHCVSGAKDLNVVEGVSLSHVLLVDDQERAIVENQRKQWIPIEEFDVPYSEDDRELERVRLELESRITQ